MLQGRILEILGLGLIVTAFMHNDGPTTTLVNAVAGGVIALMGVFLWKEKPKPAQLTNLFGLLLLVVAFLPPLRSHAYNIWIAGCCGFGAWFVGWRVVASEKGGPWRLKDRPIY